MLIAEMCQNHNGRSEILEEMVKSAADAGATHAKIQGIYSSELVFRERFESGTSGLKRPFGEEAERLAGLELSATTEADFIQWCRQHGVTPMITVFTHSGLDRAVEAGFTSFKIASYDCQSRALIERCLPHAEEVVVSTGGTKWEEVRATAQLLQESAPTVDVRLLHAVTKYPTQLEDFNPGRMLSLRIFGLPVGYSDHTSPLDSGLTAALFAAYLGASAIERHFTILDPAETRDGPVSVSPPQLRAIRDALRSSPAEASEALRQLAWSNPELLANPQFDLSVVEEESVDYYRGRFASWRGGNQVMSWEAWPDVDG